MYQLIIIVHVLLGLGVVSLVLLQQGKGADAGAAFGSGSSGSVFGAQGSSSFLSRTTAILAALFFCTSLGLAVLSGHQDGPVDLMETTEAEEVFADIPLVNDTDDSAPIKAIPMTPEEVKAGSFVPDTVSNAVKDVSDQASQLSDTVENKAGSFVEDAESAVSDSIGAIENKAGSLIDGAENIVSDGMDAVENKTESLVGGIENVVSDSVSAIENKAGSLVDGAENIVSDGMGAVENKAGSFIESAKGIISEDVDTAGKKANAILKETSGIVSEKLDMITKE